MATVDKDFKIKNGLIVNNGGSFGQPVTVATPTQSGHAVTRQYVEDNFASVVYSDTAPLNPSEGFLWFDTTVARMKIYSNADWATLALAQDLQNIPDHIHDTAIDGTGQIVSIFWDGSWYNDPQIQNLSGGAPDSVTWEFVFDGGNPESIFG